MPRETWTQVLTKDAATPWIQRLLLKLNDSTLTYRFFNPLFRFLLRSPSHFKINSNVKIMAVSDIEKYDCKAYIATNFINANQLKSFGIPLEKIILFSQIDEIAGYEVHMYTDLIAAVVVNIVLPILLFYPGTWKKIISAVKRKLSR